MGRPGWTAEIEVDADLGKVPGDPVEAAKYAVDQVRRLASPYVKVEHHGTDGITRTWLVDTADGTVNDIGPTRTESERDDEPVPADSLCEWSDGRHYDGLYRLVDREYGETTVSCGNHLADTVSGIGDVLVTPYKKDGESDG